MTGKHDSIVKALFANTEDAASALASALPREIAERIDWASLRSANLSLVDQKLREVQADLTFTARLEGHEVVLYVLLEHQSTSDALMPFRVLRYVVLIWTALLRDRPDMTRLPVVLPFVLHHGKPRWAAPTELRELFDVPADVLGLLGDHVPSFRFFLDDLSATEDEALRSRSLTAMMRACLVLLKNAPKSADVLVELGDWLDVFVEISRAPNGVDALRLLMQYISIASDAEPQNIQQFARLIGPVAEDAYMTSAEQLTQQAREESLQEGLREGRKEGRREGRREGQAELLLRLLELRFGALSESTLRRVHDAADIDLTGWADRVLSAESLDQVFGVTGS